MCALPSLSSPLRVNDSDKDDWAKLRRLPHYVKCNLGLGLTLEATDMSLIHWWVDASFAVHPDFKSHTSGMISLEKGSIIDF